jgi:hypothetical protein
MRRAIAAAVKTTQWIMLMASWVTVSKVVTELF